MIVASDHAALPAKAVVIEALRSMGVKVEDAGPSTTESVDYPDYAAVVAGAVSRGEFERGVLLCGTGIGMSIVANRFPGVRAALVHDTYGAEMARQHNDSNVLVLGGGVLGDRLIAAIVEVWWKGQFEGGRHAGRVHKIDQVAANASQGEETT